MEEDEKNIYYITGENLQSVEDSPFIEKLVKDNKDVIFMVDPLDEYIMQHVKEFEDKKLTSVSKEDINMESKDTEEFKKLCDKIKDIMGDRVEKVKVGSRIVDSPCCLVTTDMGWSANMERIMSAQALGNSDMHAYMKAKKVFEINSEHKIIKELKRRVDVNPDDKAIIDLVSLLYDVSLLRSGFSIEDGKSFGDRLTKMIELGLSLDDEDEESDEDDSINEAESNDVQTNENEDEDMEQVD